MPNTELSQQIGTTSLESIRRLDSGEEETMSPNQGFHSFYQRVNKRKCIWVLCEWALGKLYVFNSTLSLYQ